MNYGPTLEILEVEYSCSPGGVDMFEVYEIDKLPSDISIYETESLTDAVQFCYNLGQDFIVRTSAAWHREEDLDYAGV
jgi:hypothetical protein